jgi:hypothetical protein
MELAEALKTNISTNSITFIASMRLVTNYFIFRAQHMVHKFGAIYIATMVTCVISSDLKHRANDA